MKRNPARAFAIVAAAAFAFAFLGYLVTQTAPMWQLALLGVTTALMAAVAVRTPSAPRRV